MNLNNTTFKANNAAELKAILTHLEGEGYKWISGCKATEQWAIGLTTPCYICVDADRLTWAKNYDAPCHGPINKVSFAFAFAVTSVEVVPTETPQQKELREIEEQLKTLHKKAEDLRKSI
ncbi:MAG TPA: hypothetical protein VFM18_02415 [Methanosarcina sp.]|nr:hypothetical protein [Methanosarcina sp.]